MCGIYGVIANKKLTGYDYSQQEKVIKKLFTISQSRGSDASGLLILDNNRINIIKKSTNSNKIFQSKEYVFLKKQLSKEIQLFIGHTRMATHGSSINNKNNQPVISKKQGVVGIHNGIIIDYQSLHQNKDEMIPELDTQVLLDYLEKKITTIKNKKDFFNIFKQNVKKIKGVVNIALLFPKYDKLLLYSNNGSLYYLEKENLIYFASEKSTLQKIFDKEPKQIKNEVKLVELKKNSGTKTIKTISFDKKVYKEFEFKNKIETLQKHKIDQEKITKIRRCSKCILPENTPFIYFNQDYVCNYCIEHQKITYKGTSSLEEILSKHRSKNGNPDCMVAFSGGRDSSYGLHLLKKELGMNPIAFTYDWGMISDIGRRNQARMLGKLGVEQVLVSANIAKKRKHIRQNILAWLKKPELGMVPIFMQGDKQCEYYADQVMKKYKIPLMIYCRGNELENEEFKSGYCGVKDSDPGGVMRDLSFSNKLRLLGFYGKQYLQNPSYLNESIFDTAFGYFTTYIKPHNYLYLWHYLPWEENEIVKTLTEEYEWELSPDTKTSWRIGDGTPAFYNYIYYQVQGFTENDSFRSRQIREGLLTREKALELVFEENKPQYNNLKWYFDTLDIDGDKVLSAIDKMKKKYSS